MENWNNYNQNMMGMQSRMMPNNFISSPRYDIIEVNGEAGARNFRMAPNSRALLLDNTASIVWFAQTDGTGYLTVTPYDINPHQQIPPIDVNNLAERVAQLEEIINAKSNTFSNKQSKKQRSEQSTISDISTN